MSLDQKAQILEASRSKACNIRDIIHMLRCRASRAISLLKEMEQERLIELRRIRSPKRGRPEKNIVCTSLGSEFIEIYRKLRARPLRARRKDFERAVKDALYTKRLLANGHSPFELFMELNTIARNIKMSSEASETIQG